MEVSALEMALLTCGGALTGFLTAYAKRKGENLASKEDFADLAKQTKQLAEATKRIEAVVSHDYWSRQRHWELKRDNLTAALEPIGRVDTVLQRLHVALSGISSATAADPAVRSFFEQKRKEAGEAWLGEMDAFDSKRRLLLLVCNRATHDAFKASSNELRLVAQAIISRTGEEDLVTLASRVQAAREKLLAAARAELGFEPFE